MVDRRSYSSWLRLRGLELANVIFVKPLKYWANFRWTLNAALLRRFEPKRLGERGELVALLLHAGAEFGRSEHGHDLTGVAKPLGDDRILGDFLEIRRNALAQFVRHAARAKHPADALECQRRVAGFCRCRDVGHTRRALAAGHRQHLDAASLAQWLHHRKRRRENLDTTLGEIVRRLHDVAIGHPHDL